MAITRQFVLNLPTAAGRYPLTTRYSVTVLQFGRTLFPFLMIGYGGWLGWEFCFSEIEDFLYQ